MKKFSFILFCLAFGLFLQSHAEPVKLQSPDGQLEVKSKITPCGGYAVSLHSL